MSSLYFTCVVLFLQYCAFTSANLEGPFVFWGPKQLVSFRRPALNSLEQDDLLDIYNNQDAIVVFNIQDAQFHLNREKYPRLRKLLEGKSVLFAPQDFLDIHPEYVNNETQVITVQGPNSEQDAEITEKFERLEDVYGEGKVLAILGSSTPEESIDEDMDDDIKRQKREATENLREAPITVLYNATGKALLYSRDCPVLKLTNESNVVNYKLKTSISVTADENRREQYSRMIVLVPTPMGKITLRFRFLYKSGYWSIGPIEYVDPRGKDLLLLYPPSTDDFLGAPKGFSFVCGDQLVFTSLNGSVSLVFQEIQVQPQLEGAEKFGAAYNCVGFTTIPIWSGIIVSFLLLFGISIALIMISDIKTMDRFENSKGKTLTITVSE